ncbi:MULTISPECIES: hypothetical protein [Rhizobium/Agrobacterium group]|uniref:hypothetical protein n=1 Tax=Rhizobium oryzihabitans TaxID=2267833 RepID=UPI004033C298
MAELKSISISDIHIGERLREIDEDHAQAIALSIAEIGLQSPIQVRPTPAQKGGKFTLVAGGQSPAPGRGRAGEAEGNRGRTAPPGKRATSSSGHAA